VPRPPADCPVDLLLLLAAVLHACRPSVSIPQPALTTHPTRTWVHAQALTSLGVAEEARALGFMTPPYNTQYQLHLHALERPVTAKGLRGSAFDLDYSPIFKSMDYVQEQVAKKKART